MVSGVVSSFRLLWIMLLWTSTGKGLYGRVFHSLRCVPRSRIAGSWLTLCLTEELPVCFLKQLNHLHPRQQGMKVSRISPHLHWTLVVTWRFSFVHSTHQETFTSLDSLDFRTSKHHAGAWLLDFASRGKRLNFAVASLETTASGINIPQNTGSILTLNYCLSSKLIWLFELSVRALFLNWIVDVQIYISDRHTIQSVTIFKDDVLFIVIIKYWLCSPNISLCSISL